ncbi:MAG: ArsR/SmtB family transcription factor [Phycisphaerales bacterium]
MKAQERRPSTEALLSSLAEPTRLRVARILEVEELSVGELARVVQLPQSTVSRQLRVLSDAGWLVRRSAGPATLYQMVLDDLRQPARALWMVVRDQSDNSAQRTDDTRRLREVLAERKLDSETFFNQVAGEWSQVRERLFGSGGGGFTARGLLGLLPAHWTVADLGCGTGEASEHIAPHVERVIAVDQSEAMLEAARARLAGMRNVEFVAGRMDALPLEDESVDAAVCVLVLHHMADPVIALREMRRVLRAGRGGGTALVLEMLEHDREEYRRTMGHVHLGFSMERLGGMMERSGLQRVRVKALAGEADAKGPGLVLGVGSKMPARGRALEHNFM